MPNLNIVWWNLENLFDDENANRPDDLARRLRNELSGWTIGIGNRTLAQLASVVHMMFGWCENSARLSRIPWWHRKSNLFRAHNNVLSLKRSIRLHEELEFSVPEINASQDIISASFPDCTDPIYGACKQAAPSNFRTGETS